METEFIKLNDHWNADPNAPYPQAEVVGDDLCLYFYMNSFQFPQFKHHDVGCIKFTNCSRYRFGDVNDEGWYRGQCRFSNLAPEWGEFYELKGELLLNIVPDEWHKIRELTNDDRHFLFYFRDEEFECDATNWEFSLTPNKSLKKDAQTTRAF